MNFVYFLFNLGYALYRKDDLEADELYGEALTKMWLSYLESKKACEGVIFLDYLGEQGWAAYKADALKTDSPLSFVELENLKEFYKICKEVNQD